MKSGTNDRRSINIVRPRTSVAVTRTAVISLSQRVSAALATRPASPARTRRIDICRLAGVVMRRARFGGGRPFFSFSGGSFKQASRVFLAVPTHPPHQNDSCEFAYVKERRTWREHHPNL